MCRLIRFIYLVIPIQGFRAFLVQKHLEACPACQKAWGADQTMQGTFAIPPWVEEESNLWPQIRERIRAAETEEIRSRRKKAFLFPRWQWALAGSALLVLVGTLFVLDKIWIYKPTKEDLSLALKSPQVHIIHAEIHGKKAKPFIYQTKENLFIWFDESSQEED